MEWLIHIVELIFIHVFAGRQIQGKFYTFFLCTAMGGVLICVIFF